MNCSSLNCCRLDMSRAHSKGRMAASFAGGRLAVSSRPEAADKGPQAASRSLMVLLGDTPCNKSSWLPPPCIYIQACAIVGEVLAANHMACCIHWMLQQPLEFPVCCLNMERSVRLSQAVL